MTSIWIRVTRDIIGGVSSVSAEGPFELSVPRGTARPVSVVISTAGDVVYAEADFQVSDELYTGLASDTLINKLPTALELEMSGKVATLTATVRDALRLYQQEVRDPMFLQTQPFRAPANGLEWSIDREAWRPILGGQFYAAISMRPHGTLNRRDLARVQRLIDEGERPLLAIEHLWEAYRRKGSRYRWIEATTAAELAIKEVLVRIEPRLEVLLLEVPAPPIRKLYGEVLESVAGERSPFRSDLHRGAELRNKLVHRPQHVWINPQDVEDYIDTVGRAIAHVLELHRKLVAKV